MKQCFVLLILYVTFISTGLSDQVLGVAWPNMRLDFNQSLDKAGVLVALLTFASAVAGYMGSYITSRFDIAKIIIYGTVLIIIGMGGYVLSGHWAFVLVSAVPMGFGLGAIDCVLNNYAAKNLYSRHINWLHGFWGVGATLGPMILTGVYALDLSWRIGFLIIIAIQSLLLFTFLVTKDIWQVREVKVEKEIYKKSIISLNTFLSSLFFGIYVSLETAIGLWYYSYLIDYKDLSVVFAGSIISGYWAVFTIGRFVIGYLTKWFSDRFIITASIIMSIILLVFVMFDYYIAVVAIGFALAGIYPCMVNETHKRFKPKIADILMGQQIGTSYLALVVLVPFIGFLSEKFGLQHLISIFIILAFSLLLIDIRLRKLSIKKKKCNCEN